MEALAIKGIIVLEDENRRFKKFYPQERLNAETVEFIIGKKWSSQLDDENWLVGLR